MAESRVRDIKKAQKESLLYHKISELYRQITLDNPELQGLYITRIELSPDKGHCSVMFHCKGGLEEFEEKRKLLVLYKPSLRTALGKSIHSRYVPELRFKYDATFDKQQRIEEILSELQEEDKL